MVPTDLARAGTTNCWPLGASDCSYAGVMAIGCNLDAVVAPEKIRGAGFNLNLKPKRAVLKNVHDDVY